MNIRPEPLSEDWYWVESRTRPGLEHLVDIAYQDEVWRTPYEACSCEAYTINLHTMGKTCDHIKAVRDYLKALGKAQRTIAALQQTETSVLESK